MIQSPFLARQEHFDVVGSTNDVVRGWLADGVPEVCLAVANEQTGGSRARGPDVDGAAWPRAPAVARVPADMAAAGAGLAAGRGDQPRDGRCGRGGRRARAGHDPPEMAE